MKKKIHQCHALYIEMTWNSFGSLKREKTDTIQLTIKIAEMTC